MSSLLYGISYHTINSETGKYDEDAYIFPPDPEKIRTNGQRIRVLATSRMTKGLLREMLEPTNQLASLRREANINPLVHVFDMGICGYNTINSLTIFWKDGWVFQPYKLFGVRDSQTLVQLQIYPSGRDLPRVCSDILPPSPNSGCIPNMLSFSATMQLDTCLNCDAAPLGKDKLCARCLLVTPRVYL